MVPTVFSLTTVFSPIGGLIIDASGNLYGTTYEGGPFYNFRSCNSVEYNCGSGTVFELTPPSANGVNGPSQSSGTMLTPAMALGPAPA